MGRRGQCKTRQPHRLRCTGAVQHRTNTADRVGQEAVCLALALTGQKLGWSVELWKNQRGRGPGEHWHWKAGSRRRRTACWHGKRDRPGPGSRPLACDAWIVRRDLVPAHEPVKCAGRGHDAASCTDDMGTEEGDLHQLTVDRCSHAATRSRRWGIGSAFGTVLHKQVNASCHCLGLILLPWNSAAALGPSHGEPPAGKAGREYRRRPEPPPLFLPCPAIAHARRSRRWQGGAVGRRRAVRAGTRVSRESVQTDIEATRASKRCRDDSGAWTRRAAALSCGRRSRRPRPSPAI